MGDERLIMSQERFNWLTCPNCSRKLHKYFEPQFDIEVSCPSCKGIWRITLEDDVLKHEQVKRPRRLGPSEYKS